MPTELFGLLGACLGNSGFCWREGRRVKFKTCAWSLDQALLLPPSVHDFVPAGHLSRFVVALVTEKLDPDAIRSLGHRSTVHLGTPPAVKCWPSWSSETVILSRFPVSRRRSSTVWRVS